MKYSENTVKYRFCDSDETGWDEYDIEGKDYRALIDVCSRYCSFISFDTAMLDTGAEYLSRIEKHLIKVEKAFTTGDVRRYYAFGAEVCELLKKESCIFSWFWEENNPFHFENLTFYRADETVFFESVTHEGECYLYVRETEDVSQVVANELWEKNPKPIKYDFTPKTEEWVSEYLEKSKRIKDEKYTQDLKKLKEMLDDALENKTALQNNSEIRKTANKFGFSIDKVIDDIFAI